MKKGKLIVISGPSGVGKGTIRKMLFEQYNYNLAYSISMTTRTKRDEEIDGKDYYFVTHEQFKKAIEEDRLLEWAEFVGNFYGTPRDYVDNLLDQGKNVVLEIEVLGAKQILSKRPEALSIFLEPPSIKELISRIEKRKTEDETTINNRMHKADEEIKSKIYYNYIVVNDDVERATKEVAQIIKSHVEV
jgi:guanylate kinase